MSTQTKSVSAPSISLAAAADLVAAVRKAGAEAGFEVAVAVTDAGGHLKAFERTDGAPFLASEVAVDKAWTAASFRIPTHAWKLSGASTTWIAYYTLNRSPCCSSVR